MSSAVDAAPACCPLSDAENGAETPALISGRSVVAAVAAASLASALSASGSAARRLDTEGSAQLGYLVNLFARRRWFRLVPDLGHRIVTKGYGTFAPNRNVASSDCVTAAATPDGRLAIAYLPEGGTIGVDTRRMAGRVHASWARPDLGRGENRQRLTVRRPKEPRPHRAQPQPRRGSRLGPGPNCGVRLDFAVVGGGLIGLATARALLDRRPGARLAVFEKEPELGRHQSGRNSGVVHAGVYYARARSKPGCAERDAQRCGPSPTSTAFHTHCAGR